MKRLLTPFVYHSGETTLAVGTVGMFAAVAIARLGGETFRGVLSSGYGDLTFGELLLQCFAGWAVFSALLYCAALVGAGSKVRAVDLFGNQLFARLASPCCR